MSELGLEERTDTLKTRTVEELHAIFEIFAASLGQRLALDYDYGAEFHITDAIYDQLYVSNEGGVTVATPKIQIPEANISSHVLFRRQVCSIGFLSDLRIRIFTHDFLMLATQADYEAPTYSGDFNDDGITIDKNDRKVSAFNQLSEEEQRILELAYKTIPALTSDMLIETN